jgi:DNA-binding transcriptional LysR family regulator
VAVTLLPAIIRSYRDAHPAIEVTISESFDNEQLTALATGRIDAGFLRAAAAPPGIRLETLLTEPIMAALHTDHRLANHGFSPAIVQEASGISALGLVAAGLGVTVVASSYQALSLTGVRFVPAAGHQLALQVAWAADNTNTALPAFLQTARQITAQA